MGMVYVKIMSLSVIYDAHHFKILQVKDKVS